MANKTDYLVELTAKDKTAKAFNSLSRRMNNARKGMNRVAGNFAKMGSAAALAAGAAGAAFVKMRIDAIDNLAKTADKLGVTTEALAGLQHAAELTGVSSETMNMALQRMTRRVAEAANGSGEAKGALEELGISAADLQKLPLDKQMEVIADAMGGVENQSDKVRLAMKLFDSEGVALVNTLGEGSTGLRQMAQEAKTLGLTVSRIDAAQIEEASDSIVKARGVFTGLGNQIAVALSPLVSELSANFYQTALDMNGAGDVGQRVANALVRGFGFVADGVKGLKILVMGIQFVFAKMAQGATFAMSKITKSIDIAIEGYNKIAEVFGGDTIDFKPSEALASLSESFGNTAEDIKEKIQTSLNEPLPSENIMKFYEDVQTKARETAEIVAANAPAVVAQEAEVANVDLSKVSMYDKAKREGAKSLAEFEKKSAAEKTQYVMGQLDAELSGVAKHSRKLFALQKAMQVGQAIMNTYTAATKALASYPPPINAVFAGLAIANGMAQVAQIKAQSFEGGGFTGYGARAGGLDNKGGRLALIHPNESILDHTKGQGQGVTIINNVDASGGGADVDQRIRMAMEVTSQQTVRQVQDLLRRQRLA